MKRTALLTLVLLTASYPLMAKTRHAHHEVTRDSHSHITCEMVRSYVAQVGLEQAMAIAQSNGMTASEKERAKQCLAKKI
jgi:hypothetical protein